jgi:uncharacterized protein
VPVASVTISGSASILADGAKPVDEFTDKRPYNRMDKIDGFDWDAGNSEKCQKQGVTVAEIESIFISSPQITTDLRHSLAEIPARAVGQTSSGRHIFVAYTLRQRDGRRLIRPISARYMHRKEVKRYEKTRA